MRRFSLILLGILLLVGLCSCHRIAGNHPQVGYLYMQEKEGDLIIEDYKIFLLEKTYQAYEDLDSKPYLENENICYGGTALRYGFSIPSGYEGVKEHFLNLDLASPQVIEVYGEVEGDKLVGYVNVYKDTIGYLSGGGNYGVEEIDYAFIFSYQPANDEFLELCLLKEVMIVAKCDQAIMYWKNRCYYLYDLTSEEEIFLVEDKAYDTGLQHQSYTSILTNQRFTFIEMVKSKGTQSLYYLYLYDYKEKQFISLSFKSN